MVYIISAVSKCVTGNTRTVQMTLCWELCRRGDWQSFYVHSNNVNATRMNQYFFLALHFHDTHSHCCSGMHRFSSKSLYRCRKNIRTLV